jgi:hypothetical protein
MRKILVCLGLCICSLSIYSQAPYSIVSSNNSNKNISQNDTLHREVLGDRPTVEKAGDTTKIRLGKKGITIVEKNGKTTVNIDKNDGSDNQSKSDENDEYYSHRNDHFDIDDWKQDKHNSKKFRPHYAGLEIFLNNYLDKKNSLSRNSSNEFMDLNTGASWAVNINFFEYGFPITKNVGLVTGLGMEINSYHFNNNNNLMKDTITNIIVAKTAPSGVRYETSKFGDTYINVPLLLEVQFPIGQKGKPLYFSGGVLLGAKISSTSKEIFNLYGHEQKIRIHNDFNLSPLRYGFQGRVGYRAINLFATYYPTPLFVSNKGPELYPFNVGIVLIPF